MTNLKQKRFVDTDYLKEQLDSTSVGVEGSHISASETKIGYMTDIEILGNTVQNPNNLADIKSVGELQEDGTYKMSILSCGKNLFDREFLDGKAIDFTTGNYYDNPNMSSVKNYISVKSNATYYLNVSPYGWVIEYDTNKKCIAGRQFWNKFTTSENCRYVKFYIQTSVKTDTIQLEEGTVATSYEPYQENKCDILLPCQLEKVGNVSDRLYYDDVEKAWCIEKNVKTIKLNGTEQGWYLGEGGRFFEVPINDIQIPNKPIICDKYKHIVASTGDETGKIATVQHKAIRIHPSDMTGLTLEVFKKQLSQDNVLVKYPTTEPQKIVLPLDVQIQLNSFFGTTHVYMESGEVEGTIKCKIPKSLGATVQSLNNKTDILSDRIEAIEGLKDSQNMKYETDKGYLVCKETKNGVIDDLKIEGKTLVNKSKVKTKHLVSSGSRICEVYAGVPISQFTLVVDVSNLTGTLKSYGFYADNSQEVYSAGVSSNGKWIKYFNFDRPLKSFSLYVDSEGGYEATIDNIIILEGDHTQNPPSYFEGLMSVGQDVDKIEVLSRKEEGNLFDENTVVEDVSKVKVLYNKDGVLKLQGVSGWYAKVLFDKIPVNPNTPYWVVGEGQVISGNGQCACAITDGYKTTLHSEFSMSNRNAKKVSTNTGYLSLTFRCNDESNNALVEYKDIMIIKDKGYTLDDVINMSYTPHQSDKKQILFYNENGELEPIQELHEWDSIEKHSDNKWYYHKRSGKVILNGSEDWKSNVSSETTISFRLPYSVDMLQNLICDRFIHDILSSSNGIEGILISKANTINEFSIEILKSKLSSQDVTGFKKWLQANNVTVVYQLAQEEVYECIDLGVNSYEGETLVQVNSGVICPQNLAFSTQKHIGNIVNKLQERVDKNTKFREELTENMTYTETIEQGKGYTVIENSKEGVVTVPEIKGKTLVNLVNYSSMTSHGTATGNFNKSGDFIKATITASGTRVANFKTHTDINSKLVTLIINNKSTASSVRVGKKTLYASIQTLSQGVNILTINTTDLTEGIYVGNTTNLNINDVIEFSIMILEGDHTQNPPSYFEGLKSVGDDTDEIVVLSRKEDGNLIDVDFTKYDISNSNGVNIGYDSIEGLPTQGGFAIHSKVFLEKGSYVCKVNEVSGVNHRIRIREINNSDIIYANITNIKFDIKESKMYKISFENNGNTTTSFKLKGISLQHYNKGSIYPHQSDKKQILFYNTETQTWEKPVLREWDSIEKHSDNKWYYHKRSGKVVLNGSENWNLNSQLTNSNGYYDFMFRIDNGMNSNKQWNEVISDSFITVPTSESGALSRMTFEWIEYHGWGFGLNISIKGDKLSTQDVEGFKQWLQANNVTAVYQLAEEEVYECINLDLNSYNGETNVIVESGAIVPQTTVKVQNNLQEIIRNLKNRVRQLEEDIYNYKVNQNLRQLRTFYKSDYANFGVATLNNYSVEPTSIAITPYGYDLFEIFKEVIAQGKDKYDRIELEEYIDFYLMTFVFDFDMVFELFDLLDANEDIIEDEPVEEEPPTEEEEDVVEDTPTILPNLPEDEATPIPLI